MSFKVGFDMKRKRGNIKRIWLIFASMIFLITSCTENNNTPQTEQPKDYSKAPKGFPPIPFPADNPYSKAKFELGRRLFL